MKATVRAELNIEVLVSCPHCEEVIDLMNEYTTNGYNHNEEGWILRQAVPNRVWIEEHKNFKCVDVTCTECKTNFNVEGLDW